MKCLICGNELKSCICPRCGFDLSQCRESFPTLGALPPAGQALCTRRDAMIRALNDRIAELERELSEGKVHSVRAKPRKPEIAAEQPKNSAEKPESAVRQETWECVCGSRNAIDTRYCAVCGKNAPGVITKGAGRPGAASRKAGGKNARQTKPSTWSCSCGSRNADSTRYCPVCGKSRP